MPILVDVIMLGWIPFVILCFSSREPEEASLICFVSAWLFLPEAEYTLPGLPDYNKISATCYGIAISAWLFDRERVTSWRPTFADVPMFLFCISPFFSSILNGLGPYDGFSCSLAQTVAWGLPYLIGRIYFSSPEAIWKLIQAIILGGLIYVPLCLIEVKMSPQLHRWLYGYHVADFGQSMRYGGFRPTVFMEHGLMVGMWMATATLCAFWVCFTKGAPAWFRHRRLVLPIFLLITLILVKSTGALGLLVMGLSLLYGALKLKITWPLILLLALPLFYLVTRSTGYWDGQSLIRWAESSINRERGQSLAFRIENEELIATKARNRQWFGWGDWGRWRVYNEDGEDITISDSLWVIIFGRNGYFGLAALFAFLLLPISRILTSLPASKWFEWDTGPRVVLSILCALYAIDCLLNAMVNPFFALISGSVIYSYSNTQEMSSENNGVQPCQAI